MFKQFYGEYDVERYSLNIAERIFLTDVIMLANWLIQTDFTLIYPLFYPYIQTAHEQVDSFKYIFYSMMHKQNGRSIILDLSSNPLKRYTKFHDNTRSQHDIKWGIAH